MCNRFTLPPSHRPTIKPARCRRTCRLDACGKVAGSERRGRSRGLAPCTPRASGRGPTLRPNPVRPLRTRRRSRFTLSVGTIARRLTRVKASSRLRFTPRGGHGRTVRSEPRPTVSEFFALFGWIPGVTDTVPSAFPAVTQATHQRAFLGASEAFYAGSYVHSGAGARPRARRPVGRRLPAPGMFGDRIVFVVRLRPHSHPRTTGTGSCRSR